MYTITVHTLDNLMNSGISWTAIFFKSRHFYLGTCINWFFHSGGQEEDRSHWLAGVWYGSEGRGNEAGQCCHEDFHWWIAILLIYLYNIKLDFFFECEKFGKLKRLRLTYFGIEFRWFYKIFHCACRHVPFTQTYLTVTLILAILIPTKWVKMHKVKILLYIICLWKKNRKFLCTKQIKFLS